MQRNKVHFINTVMTGRGIPGYGGDKWYKYRVDIFKKYCIKSLQNQSNKKFIHWICFRPEEKNNPTTRELAKYLDGIKYKYVFTFYGQPFPDDKRTTNLGLEDRVRKSLESLKKYTEGKKYVYFTVLDSDDMFHRDLVKLVQKEEYELRKALTPVRGLILNNETGQLANWEHPSCPPFYTILFPVEIFMDAKKHLEYYYPFRSHEDILKIFKCKRMKDFLYCATCHKGNISTAWENSVRGQEYFYDNQKEEILKDFGIKL